MDPVNSDGSEEQLLLPETRKGDQSWRLNFDGFDISTEHKEKPPRGLHDYLGVLGKILAEFQHSFSNSADSLSLILCRRFSSEYLFVFLYSCTVLRYVH